MEAEAEAKKKDKNYTQILARKSLAKAKKIACLVEKQKKENEEHEEVNISVSPHCQVDDYGNIRKERKVTDKKSN